MRPIWRLLQLLGLACLAIVVLTHVAEAFHLFPTMGWGQSNSAGHYVDLFSAILGCTLLLLGLIGSAFMRRKNLG
jgi:ABC-type transport system involved in multi-copper enzyme maturation permease subunit